jgi:uncharacterized protein (DUF2252 family)
MRDPITEFMNYNRSFARRNPELLRLKVARMADSPFSFFRGTFHLYARDVIDRLYGAMPLLSGEGAELELVGDLHSENYGTYKAEDGVVHYDINDFDETTHGRLDLDVCRLATSLFLAARDCNSSVADAVQVTLAGLQTYSDSVRRFLKKGRTGEFDLKEGTATEYPPVAHLIDQSAAVKRPEFIGKITEVANGRRRLIRSLRYFNLPENEVQQAQRLLDDYRKRMPEPPTKDFYEVEDVCGRVSGVGSMGRFRYVALVAGKGKKEARNVLLELKEARPSAYDLYRNRETSPDAFKERAKKVIAVQKESQAASSPYLGFAVDDAMSFQVRELGPNDARLDFKELKGRPNLELAARAQAGILARTHARAAGRAVGPVNPLAELNDADVFEQRVLAFALFYADQVRRDWGRFVGQRQELENCEKWPDPS